MLCYKLINAIFKSYNENIIITTNCFFVDTIAIIYIYIYICKHTYRYIHIDTVYTKYTFF